MALHLGNDHASNVSGLGTHSALHADEAALGHGPDLTDQQAHEA